MILGQEGFLIEKGWNVKISYIYAPIWCYTAFSRLIQLTCACFLVSFIILIKLVNTVRFSEKKKKRKAMYKYTDLTVEANEDYFEISFLGVGVLLNSVMDIYCSTAEEGQTKIGWLQMWGRGRSKVFTLRSS